MTSRKPVAVLCIALTLGQLCAPLLAHAENPPVKNPFSNIPAPVTPQPHPVPGGNTVPTRPTPLAPPQTDQPLVCVDPNPAPALTPYQRLVSDYVAAYYSDNPSRTHYMAEILRQVFANADKADGVQDYIDKMKYLDQQASYAPEAMYDVSRALQNRWEAAYGMELNARVQAGLADPNSAQPETPGQRRADRVHIGQGAGAIIGGIVALAALGIACVRNPTAIPRYNAVFRALLPAIGFTGGMAIGHGVATGLNNAGVFDRNIPVAPAHVMHLGVERDDFTQNDGTLVRTLVPLILSIGAGEAVFAAAEGETLAATLLGVIRAIRVANVAATPAKINPYVLVGSIIVTIVVEKLAAAGIEAWQYGNLKTQVINSRNIVDFGVKANDNVTLYRGADALVATTLNIAAFINRPILEANNEFVEGITKASKDYAEGSPDYNYHIEMLTRELSNKVIDATGDMDQAGDVDYEAYLALEALEHQDASILDDTTDLARNRAQAYVAAFETYKQGFNAYLDKLEERQRASLNEAARMQAYNDFFHQYLGAMRAAKDRELARNFRAGQIPKHAGHILLQASALLRTTGREYVQTQADFLMAAVARNENLIRAAMSQAAQGPKPDYTQFDPGPWQ